MADSFVIKSVKTDAVLEFSNLGHDSFNVLFRSSPCIAMTNVWLDEAWLDDGVNRFANLFREMAKQWHGWDNRLAWKSAEGEFALEAVSDSWGHVELIVTFDKPNEAEPWYFRSSLFIEAGQLDALAKEAKRFFVDSTTQTGK